MRKVCTQAGLSRKEVRLFRLARRLRTTLVAVVAAGDVREEGDGERDEADEDGLRRGDGSRRAWERDWRITVSLLRPPASSTYGPMREERRWPPYFRA